MHGMSRLLDVRGLCTQFDLGRRKLRVLEQVSFGLDRGEVLGIVGESGSGKSVTAMSILGLLPQPTGHVVEGEILFDGQDLTRLSDSSMRAIRGRRIGMIFQDALSALNPVLTVGVHIVEVLETHLGLRGREARQRAAKLLTQVGIPAAHDRLDDYPHQFSGGMRQRVMIAIAIACSPQLLIADEPTTALDVTIQEEIISLVRSIRDELGMAVIWIAHDLASIASLADRVIIMYAGRIVEEAPIGEVFRSPLHPYTVGLLRSIPRLDAPRGGRLPSIDGLPPDAANLPQGCPFHPRCPQRVAECLGEVPELREVETRRRVACIRV